MQFNGKCVKSTYGQHSLVPMHPMVSPPHTHTFVVGIGPSKLVLLGGWSSYEFSKSFNDLKVL